MVTVIFQLYLSKGFHVLLHINVVGHSCTDVSVMVSSNVFQLQFNPLKTVK